LLMGGFPGEKDQSESCIIIEARIKPSAGEVTTRRMILDRHKKRRKNINGKKAYANQPDQERRLVGEGNPKTHEGEEKKD